MLMLARELSGCRVAITTTTRMAEDELPQWLDPVELGGSPARGNLEAALGKGRFPVIVYSKIENGKIIGVPGVTVDAMHKEIDIVLVEADGARGLPVKVPKPTEPVIPGSTTKVVVVYGFDGLDRPLGPETCYNLDGVVERVKGVEPGQVLDPPVLRRIFIEGGFIEASEGKRLFALVNKSEMGEERAAEFARNLYNPAVDAVGISSAKAGWARRIDNSDRRITGIILAAGEGRRFGGGKLIATVRGKPVLERVIECAASARLERLILVLGADGSELISRFGRNLPPGTVTVINPHYKSGMSTSIRKGMESAKGSGAVMIFLGDMPFITATLTEKVISAYRNSCAWACRPVCGKTPGHPVIIGRELFGELENIAGDEGAKRVLGKVEDRTILIETGPETQRDIDSEADLDKSGGALDGRH
jgi:molybdenum cofactor cytidylyltransferase